MISPSRLLPALLLSCLALLVAHPSAAEPPNVVASIKPIHSLVAAVMRGVADPYLLLRGNESPHSFSLRPSDARALQQAQLVFWVGPELELPLQRILANLPPSRQVALLHSADIESLPLRHSHDEPNDYKPSAPEHDHQASKLDPHFWLSPENAIRASEEIARRLSGIDPINAGRYRENASELKARLRRLDAELRVQFAGIKGNFAVFHDAYQYLDARYHLHSVGAVTTHPERGPGAAHLSDLRRILREQQVRCLFSEPQFQDQLVASLVADTPVHHAVLDPIGADVAPGVDAYVQVMQRLADSFVGCMHTETSQ